MPLSTTTTLTVAIALAPVLALTWAGAGCSSPASGATKRVVRSDRSDLPLAAATPAERARFRAGDELFETTLREADGLGPLYVRAACSDCHQADGRGPGLVGKMAVVEADGVTAARDQSALRFGPTQRPYATAGATRPLLAPREAAARARVTYRLPPPVFGRGYLEAVSDEAILAGARAAAARGGEGVPRGRPARLPSGALGRFGAKARLATLRDFTADAFNGDMGITSPLLPEEPANPDGRTDDAKPGVDVTLEMVTVVADYVRLLEIPARRPAPPRGPALFAATQCADCHTPTLATDPHFPVAALAGIQAPVYTDLLLHDMGTANADGIVEGAAREREWRTSPLIGLRFFPSFLHDGRARTVEEAIAGHAGPGSEANQAVARFQALGAGDRQALLDFVAAL